MFVVYLESTGGVKKHFTQFDTEVEAIQFCEDHGWE